MAKKKWMQKVSERMEKKGTKGALHRELGTPEDETIPMSRINSEISKLRSKAEGDKTLSDTEQRKLRRLQMAKKFKKAG